MTFFVKKDINAIKLPVKYSKLSYSERCIIRNEYIRQQNNLCWYCQGKLDQAPPRHIWDAHIDWSLFPKNFQKYPIHLHHDHNNDYTIGAVHMRCNAVLWQVYGQ